MNTAFDPEYIKRNTNPDNQITFVFKRRGCDYMDESIWQTIFYDNDKFVMIDDWGSDTSVATWNEVLEVLEYYEAEILLEICFNNNNNFIDVRKIIPSSKFPKSKNL